jgi:[ribosomal protein S5]-alanine N-acetyltransferase
MALIETERLCLREIEIADAAFTLELLNEPGFLQNVGDRGLRTIDDAVRYIENGPRANYARYGFGHYVVELKESGEAIGLCGLRTRPGLEDPDLGYAVLQRHWAHGYASEAARAVLDYSRRLGLVRVLAICAPANTPSITILEKLGFRFQYEVILPGETNHVRVYAWDAPA